MNSEDVSLWITVDLRASENVVSELILSNTPTVPPRESTEAARYVAANGTSVLDRGENGGSEPYRRWPQALAQHASHRCEATSYERI